MLPTAFCLLLGTGCSKGFLDVAPQGSLTQEAALADPNAAQNLVTGVYNSLYFGGLGSNNTVGILMAFLEMTTDNADKGSTPGDYDPGKELQTFTFTPNTSVFNDLWKGHYQGISRANQALNVLERATFDETTKKRYIGEVRFIRGMYYFNLVRLFGGVPKLLRVPDASEANNDEFQTRATAQEIYDVVIEDLQYSADNLPEKGEPGSQVGRATKGAAQALLAKVYLYLGNYQQAFNFSKAVIDSNKYSLVDDFNYVFRERAVNGQGGNNNSESVFEVNTGTLTDCAAISKVYSAAQGPRSSGGWNDLGFGLNNPSISLANAYDPADERRDPTIIFIQPNGTYLWDGFRIPSADSVENDRYNYKAYHSAIAETPGCGGPGDKDNKPKNIRLIRYSEVLLIYAEAANHVGQTGEAFNKLQMVRTRANLTTTTSTDQDIWNERRLELAFEHDRFFDLVRTGQAATVLASKGFVANKHSVFPIPQIQRDLSGNRLTQNPNYPQ